MQPPSETVLPHDFPGGRLRRLRQRDLASFQAYRRMPELGRYQGWSPMPDAEALAFLGAMNEAPLFMLGQWVQLGIADSKTERLIGDIGVYLSKDGFSSEIGFTLDPAAQGRGIATTAVREALHILFANTKVERAFGVTDGRNSASVRLLERAGFMLQETRQVIYRGEPCVEKVYAFQRNGS